MIHPAVSAAGPYYATHRVNALWCRNDFIYADMIIRATELQERYRYSFWDSLIIAAASAAGAGTLLSEDLRDGQTIEGVRIKNPFV